MKAISKLLTLLLVLVMVLTLIPNLARAEEAPAETETITAHIPFKVNPLYEGMIRPEDLDIPEIPESDPEQIHLHAGYYSTAEQAAATFRSYMKQRAQTFTLYIQASHSDYNALANEVIATALEHTGNPLEGDYLMWQYGGAEANVTRSYNSATSMYEFTYEFAVVYYTDAGQEQEVTTAVNLLINNLGLRNKTDYEKISAVYDWICQNVTYDYENLEDTTYTRKHTAYAALIDKTAVCQGYALLFYRMMLELGVDNRLIAGLGNGGAHGWNIVELDNLYYNVDSTWDAGRDPYDYFLRTESTFGDHARYMDYATLDFLTTYPMSAKDYVKGEKAEAIDVLFGGQCGDDAYWEIDMDRELTIFGTGAVYDYPYSASAHSLPPWHYWEEELYTIVVEEGITVLGNYTFCDQINLTKVTLPSTLKEIRARAFIGCEKLASINIPDGVTYIDGAFEGCGLTSIVIPNSVKDLDLNCFKDCVNLKTVVLGTGLTEIKYATFKNCDSLTSITLPNTITNIGEEAFSGCDSLKEITIPAGVKTMGRGALADCQSLEKVVFKGKTNLSTIFSQYNEKLKTVYFYGTAPTFAYNTFFGLTVTCYYPKGSPSWTEEVRQQYEGQVTWVAMNVTCTEHDYEAVVTAPTCIEQGYTTYTCAVCGESYVGDYTDPVDHVYVDGYCKWCGKGQAYAKIISYSTSLGGNIAMNFYVELSEDLIADPDAYVQFSFAGKTVNVPLSEGVDSGNNVYRFACPITSKNMTDDITTQVYNADGPVGDPKTMAVDTYCNWIIANTNDQKTINLMKAMLNYGASAQMLFSYRTDDLANAALADADKVFAKVDASAFAHSRTGEEEGIKPVSYTLLLDSETTVRCYFELTGDKSIEEFTFMVDGEEVTPVYKDGYYYIEKANIAAHRLDDMHTFTCGNITITYGGLSYVNQVMTYYTSGTTFDMASALYAYSKAAEAYID